MIGPYVLAAGRAALWAISGILQTFRSDVRRALQSGWSALFIGTHIVFIVVIYLLALRVAPSSSDPWLLAIIVGVGGQVLLRTQINLLQPLDPNASQSVSLSLADLYGRFQRFCREQIDQHLAIGRLRLLQQATRLPVEELEKLVRLYSHASILHPPEEIEEYLTKLREKSNPEERSLYLASYLLRQAGFAFLQDQLKARPERRSGHTA